MPNTTQQEMAHLPGSEEPAPDRERGTVVLYSLADANNPSSHDYMTRTELGRRLAALAGCNFAGEHDARARYRYPLYFLPSDTLRAEQARTLGIASELDLFGGVVPESFVATKIITHPLVNRYAVSPRGWSWEFGEAVQEVVLRGFSAFSRGEARVAGLRLLEKGPVRVKQAEELGGRGQSVASDVARLDTVLDAIDSDAFSRSGVVIEENLVDISTRSVGQVRVGEWIVSYYGTQTSTSDNSGLPAYGGSELTLVPGDFDALFALDLPREARLAIEQARAYDCAAFEHFPGLFASRRNYDVAQGLNAAGQWCSGVLEQSWRLGGASGPEVAALEAFARDPTLTTVRASSVEIYGGSDMPPEGAVVYFRGNDERVGWITKYTLVRGSHADPR